MFGKIKKAAADKLADHGVVAKVVENLSPHLSEQLHKVQELDGKAVACDDTFTSKFISPTLTALAVAAGGATKLIPNFDGRFTGAMLHTRDELVNVCAESGNVSLVGDFQQRLPQVLLEGFKKSA